MEKLAMKSYLERSSRGKKKKTRKKKRQPKARRKMGQIVKTLKEARIEAKKIAFTSQNSQEL